MRKKILYISHVDWDWIKQRPQFLAEQLSLEHDVTVLYLYSLKRSSMTHNESRGLRLLKVPNLPFQYDLPWLYKANRSFLRSYFAALLKKMKPDVIWLTHPVLYDYMPHNTGAKLVYDCMDDVQGFGVGSGFYQDRLLQLEKNLTKDAALVLSSSENLAKTLDGRQPCADKIHLLRNAFNGKILNLLDSTKRSGKHIICYTGTISDWFDFEALAYCAEKFENIEFRIVGPITVDVEKRQHPRIIFAGQVSHEKLPQLAEEADCFIMPFRLNGLIRSVDPVKLYEYVNYGKPIISVYYDEIKRFEPFVTFYKEKEELAEKIRELIDSGFTRKYYEEERIDFLNRNSWSARGSELMRMLDEL